MRKNAVTELFCL